MEAAERQILDADEPQAFKHFTYHWQHSNRKLMVCDIQSVLSKKGSNGAPMMPHIYCLTDNCIHYESTRGRSCPWLAGTAGQRPPASLFSRDLDCQHWQ